MGENNGTEFPTLDGTVYDLTEFPSVYRPDERYIYKTEFTDEANPWWLTLNDAAGNGGQTFSGLASDGTGGTTLTTGTAAVDEWTALETDPITWSNWSDVWLLAWGLDITPDDDEARFFISWGDDGDPSSITEGFYYSMAHDAQTGFARVVTGGADQNNCRGYQESTQENMFGFRVFRNDDNPNTTGHHLHWYYNWGPFDAWDEAGGFPTAAARPLRVGIITKDTAADRSLDIDGVCLVLVP